MFYSVCKNWNGLLNEICLSKCMCVCLCMRSLVSISYWCGQQTLPLACYIFHPSNSGLAEREPLICFHVALKPKTTSRSGNVMIMLTSKGFVWVNMAVPAFVCLCVCAVITENTCERNLKR